MRACLFAVALAGLSGCTSWALREAAVRQVESSSDLRYREVVENLAMIDANPFALPAYSSIYAGVADVNDNLKATSVTAWARTAAKPVGYMTAFATGSIDILGSRAVKATWTLDPTIVPEKLRAMRAACQFVLGQPVIGPDFDLLRNYQQADGVNPPSPNGYYFGVENRLYPLRECEWLHRACSRTAIPRRACYWAGCGGKYVWVGPEGLEYLSQFALVIQAIARVNFATVYYPQTLTRSLTYQIQIDSHDPSKTPLSPATAATASVSVTLDQNGLLTPGAGLPAIPLKNRVDNVGLNSDLKAVINATAKSAM